MSKEFTEVKESIESSLEEIRKQSPELYEFLKKSIIMDESKDTFKYQTNDDCN